MNKQELAQSNKEITSPLPTAPEGKGGSYAVVTPQNSFGDECDALVEVENMSKMPTEAVQGRQVEVRNSGGTLADTVLLPAIPKLLRPFSPFWQKRLIEAGLILSMGLYYLVGNPNFGAGPFLHLLPYLYSFPFLAIFAFFCWYGLPFALAFLPLALPYYGDHMQKAVFSYHSRQFEFSLAEITLAVCALVALGQFLVYGKRWRYRLSLSELINKLGPFAIGMLIFLGAALVSILVAVNRQTALRTLHEEIIAPLLYVFLALCCLRTTEDVKRLLLALLGSAMIVAIVGLIQYFYFPGQLQTSTGSDRVHAMYGSANSIGLFLDYALPLGMALLIFQVNRALRNENSWWPALLVLASFVPLVGVLVFSQSLGAALALPVAFLFILAMSVRSRKTLLMGVGAFALLLVGAGIFLQRPLINLITHWHDSSQGISTLTKRLYLWQSAWHMIQYYPWFGVGLDNWLCHYSPNWYCVASQKMVPHFWITLIPGTNKSTGLEYEATLSHPHDIFLHIWVSIGIFGLLAFIAVLVLFFWLFARMVRTVRTSSQPAVASSEWVIIGMGGAILAAIIQGLVDSSFLEQDLAFCFWMLVAALLIMRSLIGTPWRRTLPG